MTAEEAVAIVYHVLDLSHEQRSAIAALIEQQAQQIEDMKNCENCRHSYTDFGQTSPCGECNLGRANVKESKWELVGK